MYDLTQGTLEGWMIYSSQPNDIFISCSSLYPVAFSTFFFSVRYFGGFNIGFSNIPVGSVTRTVILFYLVIGASDFSRTYKDFYHSLVSCQRHEIWRNHNHPTWVLPQKLHSLRELCWIVRCQTEKAKYYSTKFCIKVVDLKLRQYVCWRYCEKKYCGSNITNFAH